MIRLKNMFILVLVLLTIFAYLSGNFTIWMIKKGDASDVYQQTLASLSHKQALLLKMEKTLAEQKIKYKKIAHLIIDGQEVSSTILSLRDLISLKKYDILGLDVDSLMAHPKYMNIARVKLKLYRKANVPLDVSANMLCSLLNSMFKIENKECTLKGAEFNFNLIKG